MLDELTLDGKRQALQPVFAHEVFRPCPHRFHGAVLAGHTRHHDAGQVQTPLADQVEDGQRAKAWERVVGGTRSHGSSSSASRSDLASSTRELAADTATRQRAAHQGDIVFRVVDHQNAALRGTRRHSRAWGMSVADQQR
jgi:hypothetical protein